MNNWAINRLTAPDVYGTEPPSGALDYLPELDHINIDVVNQGIYWTLKQVTVTSGKDGEWSPTEVFMSPGSRTLTRPGMVGIKIRAAIPHAQLPAGAVQAVVTVEAVAR